MSRLFVGQRYMGTGELQYARTPPLLFGVSPLPRSPMNGISRRVESYMVAAGRSLTRLLSPRLATHLSVRQGAVLDPDNIRGDPRNSPAGPEKRPRTITFILFILINASRQTFLELHPSAGEPRHDRSRRNLRDVGYLLVREIFLVAERQDLTEFRRQFIHCFPN